MKSKRGECSIEEPKMKKPKVNSFPLDTILDTLGVSSMERVVSRRITRNGERYCHQEQGVRERVMQVVINGIRKMYRVFGTEDLGTLFEDWMNPFLGECVAVSDISKCLKTSNRGPMERKLLGILLQFQFTFCGK